MSALPKETVVEIIEPIYPDTTEVRHQVLRKEARSKSEFPKVVEEIQQHVKDTEENLRAKIAKLMSNIGGTDEPTLKIKWGVRHKKGWSTGFIWWNYSGLPGDELGCFLIHEKKKHFDKRERPRWIIPIGEQFEYHKDKKYVYIHSEARYLKDGVELKIRDPESVMRYILTLTMGVHDMDIKMINQAIDTMKVLVKHADAEPARVRYGSFIKEDEDVALPKIEKDVHRLSVELKPKYDAELAKLRTETMVHITATNNAGKVLSTFKPQGEFQATFNAKTQTPGGEGIILLPTGGEEGVPAKPEAFKVQGIYEIYNIDESEPRGELWLRQITEGAPDKDLAKLTINFQDKKNKMAAAYRGYLASLDVKVLHTDIRTARLEYADKYKLYDSDLYSNDIYFGELQNIGMDDIGGGNGRYIDQYDTGFNNRGAVDYHGNYGNYENQIESVMLLFVVGLVFVFCACLCGLFGGFVVGTGCGWGNKAKETVNVSDQSDQV